MALEQLGPLIIDTVPHALTGSELRELTTGLKFWHEQDALARLSFWFGIATGHLLKEEAEAAFTENFGVMIEALQKVEKIHEQANRASKPWESSTLCRFVAPFGGCPLTPLLHFLTGIWICSCSNVETKHATAAIKTMELQVMRWLKIIDEAGHNLE